VTEEEANGIKQVCIKIAVIKKVGEKEEKNYGLKNAGKIFVYLKMGAFFFV
jgi:hypothetical protein